MANTVGSLLIRIGASIGDLQEKLDKAERRMMRFSNKMANIGGQLSATVSLPIIGAGAAAVRSAAQFEQLEASLSILTGSAKKGEEVFRRLKEFAATTPFELTDIVNAEKQLLAFGFSVDHSYNALQYLGDIAAATGGDLNGLTTILGQAKAIGAVYTADLRQLANRGIPIFDVLQKKLQVSGEELNKMVTDGKIDFRILEAALMSMTQEGGLFFQGMQKQAQTTAGAFSNFQDVVNLTLADFGEAIMEAFSVRENLIRFTEWIGDLKDRFMALDDSQKRMIVTVAAVAAAIGPLLIGISSIAKMVTVATSGFSSFLGVLKFFTTLPGLIVAGLVALAATLVYLYQKSEKARAVMDGLAAAVKEIIKVLSESLGAFMRGFKELGEGEFKKAYASFGEAFNKSNVIALALTQGKRVAKAYTDAHADSLERSANEGKFDPYADKDKIIADAAKAGQMTGDAFAIAAEESKEMKKLREKMAELSKKEKTPLKGIKGGDLIAPNVIEGTGYWKDDVFVKVFDHIGDKVKHTASIVKKGMEVAFDKKKVLEFTTEAGQAFKDLFDGLKVELDPNSPFAQFLERFGDDIAEGIEKGMRAVGALDSLFQTFTANRQAAIDQYYNSEKQRIDESRMSEEAKQKAMQKLEEDTDKKRRKLARAQAIREKILGIIQATIATAVNVTKNLANPILAAIVGAMGAAQIALIASQKIPALAGGGLAYGPSMAMVGDNRSARVDPEVIAPLSRLEQMLGGMGANQVYVTGRISGKDILLIQERAQQDRTRTRGF
jgi:tape measure domain-containing protein